MFFELSFSATLNFKELSITGVITQISDGLTPEFINSIIFSSAFSTISRRLEKLKDSIDAAVENFSSTSIIFSSLKNFSILGTVFSSAFKKPILEVPCRSYPIKISFKEGFKYNKKSNSAVVISSASSTIK